MDSWTIILLVLGIFAILVIISWIDEITGFFTKKNVKDYKKDTYLIVV